MVQSVLTSGFDSNGTQAGDNAPLFTSEVSDAIPSGQ